ncbi:MAG: response regulator [Lachnospiraceae bacterium]|nr:response regulator [Lachnospiraceae bacterium]
MKIGEVIRSKRQKKNLTQAGLAELLKVTPQAVSRWEMGISYPDIAMVPKISEVLRVSADELLGIRLSNENPEPGEENGDATVLNQDQVDSIFDYIPEPVSGKSKRVLVVDDADFMRMMLEDMLTHQGHIVLQAKNGQECLERLQDEAVDVCVLDICMPGMDGIEVLKRIKERQPELRVVMVSALSQESNVKQALRIGADAFVVKPFQGQSLIDRVG